MKIILLLLIFGLGFSGQVYTKPRSSTVLPVGESIETVSESFLGSPYHNNPLGEGLGNYDPDPTFRTDLFDCTTFIETVWAISFTHGPSDWTSNLQKIRYLRGDVSFVKRLHFISLDWMPYHLSRGALIDMTKAIGGDQVVESITLIDRKSWYEKMHPAQLALFNQTFPSEQPQNAKLVYVSFEALLNDAAALERLKGEVQKSPLIVNFLRPNWDTVRFIGTRIDVSHQGFVLWKNGAFVLRHASAANGRVKDDDFIGYIRGYRTHPALKGMQFVRILSL